MVRETYRSVRRVELMKVLMRRATGGSPPSTLAAEFVGNKEIGSDGRYTTIRGPRRAQRSMDGRVEVVVELQHVGEHVISLQDDRGNLFPWQVTPGSHLHAPPLAGSTVCMHHRLHAPPLAGFAICMGRMGRWDWAGGVWGGSFACSTPLGCTRGAVCEGCAHLVSAIASDRVLLRRVPGCTRSLHRLPDPPAHCPCRSR